MKVKDAMHGPAEWVDEETPVSDIAERPLPTRGFVVWTISA